MRGRCSIFGLRIIVAMVSWFWTIPVFAQDLIQRPKPLLLLQPLGGVRSIAPSGGLTMLYQYFNSSFPWLIGVAAGVAVLQTLRGGIAILLSGGDPGKRSEGISTMTWSIAGLLLIAFAGFILRILNPMFYK